MVKRRLHKVTEQFLNDNGVIFTLLRSGASSQLCGWIDMIVSFVLFAFCNMTPWMSTATGAFVGGVFNCIINYRFTFHARDVAWRAVITKFLFVWMGSLLLNSFGTQILYYLVRDWRWLTVTIGLGDDSIFLATRLLVSLVVSLGWNFILQRNFVYRQTSLDQYILRALDAIGIKDRKYGNTD